MKNLEKKLFLPAGGAFFAAAFSLGLSLGLSLGPQGAAWADEEGDRRTAAVVLCDGPEEPRACRAEYAEINGASSRSYPDSGMAALAETRRIEDLVAEAFGRIIVLEKEIAVIKSPGEIVTAGNPLISAPEPAHPSAGMAALAEIGRIEGLAAEAFERIIVLEKEIAVIKSPGEISAPEPDSSETCGENPPMLIKVRCACATVKTQSNGPKYYMFSRPRRVYGEGVSAEDARQNARQKCVNPEALAVHCEALSAEEAGPAKKAG